LFAELCQLHPLKSFFHDLRELTIRAITKIIELARWAGSYTILIGGAVVRKTSPTAPAQKFLS
jgi:hypothetical protein